MWIRASRFSFSFFRLSLIGSRSWLRFDLVFLHGHCTRMCAVRAACLRPCGLLALCLFERALSKYTGHTSPLFVNLHMDTMHERKRARGAGRDVATQPPLLITTFAFSVPAPL